MAHPNIDIIQEPLTDGCPNAVYNCIPYCFQANDYREVEAVQATFELILPSSPNWNNGLTMEIAGQTFTTASTTTKNTFNGASPLTGQEVANRIAAMFIANQYINNLFKVVLGVESVKCFARDLGAIQDYTFDVSNLPFMVAVIVNGVDAIYKENYKLVTEIWECDQNGALIEKISEDAYSPNPDTLQVCIDISTKLQSKLETTLSFDINFPLGGILDQTAMKFIRLRYGQFYDTGSVDCDIEPQYFDVTDRIVVINAALPLHKKSTDISAFCIPDNWRPLTNQPSRVRVCPDSKVYLWSYPIKFWENNPDDTWTVNFRAYYEDGTNMESFVNYNLGLQPSSGNYGLWIESVDRQTVKNLTDPSPTAKPIIAYDVEYIYTPDGGSPTVIFTQSYDVDYCCNDKTTFLFQNELGGIDTILFNRIDEISLVQSSSAFTGFMECDGAVYRGGKSKVDFRAFDKYKVFSALSDSYDNRLWLREFLKSPKKFVQHKIDGGTQLYKILLLNEEVQYWVKDEQIFLELEYILSFETNQQIN